MIRMLLGLGRRFLSQERPVSAADGGTDTVCLLLDEARAALDREFDSIRALDHKAATLFGAASVVVSLMALTAGTVVQSAPTQRLFATHLRCALALGAVLYLAVLFCTVQAFRLRTYYLPLKTEREEILKAYLPLEPDQARKQLLANYIEYSGHNASVREQKARWVQSSLYITAINTGYLTVLLIVVLLVL